MPVFSKPPCVFYLFNRYIMVLLLETCWNLSFYCWCLSCDCQSNWRGTFRNWRMRRGTPRGAGRIDFQLCLFDLLKNRRKKPLLILPDVTLVATCWMFAKRLASNTCSEVTSGRINRGFFLFFDKLKWELQKSNSCFFKCGLKNAFYINFHIIYIILIRSFIYSKII